MSGSISVGPLPPLVPSTSVPLHPPLRPPLGAAPAPDGTAFQSLLAGSPAPVVAASPSPCLDPGGPARMAGLVPTASRLPVAPGAQAIGRILAGADLSMAAWPAPAQGGVSVVAASAATMEAVRPVAPAGMAATHRLLSSFL
ncbi:MAG: hypothetical protein RIS88_2412 [Pseudomonadota bacterium]|jgi:hypothetical protein